MRVLMQGKEAEQLVVVVKSVKTDRTKRLHHQALSIGQPIPGRNQ